MADWFKPKYQMVDPLDPAIANQFPTEVQGVPVGGRERVASLQSAIGAMGQARDPLNAVLELNRRFPLGTGTPDFNIEPPPMLPATGGLSVDGPPMMNAFPGPEPRNMFDKLNPLNDPAVLIGLLLRGRI